jgi:hypothetical protein
MKYFHPFLVERVCSRLQVKRGDRVTIKFVWQEKYTEALLELNREELPRRITVAEEAIYQRIEELRHSGMSSTEERCAIDDALRGLRVLARSESQPRRPPNASGPQNNEVAP